MAAHLDDWKAAPQEGLKTAEQTEEDGRAPETGEASEEPAGPADAKKEPTPQESPETTQAAPAPSAAPAPEKGPLAQRRPGPGKGPFAQGRPSPTPRPKAPTPKNKPQSGVMDLLYEFMEAIRQGGLAGILGALFLAIFVVLLVQIPTTLIRLGVTMLTAVIPAKRQPSGQ